MTRLLWTLLLAALAALLLAATCHPLPPPAPGPGDAGADALPPPLGDSGPATDAGSPEQDCQRAGARLKELACRDGMGLPLWQGPTGEPYSVACVREYRRGYDQHAACMATIVSCDQVDSAFQGFLCADGGAP